MAKSSGPVKTIHERTFGEERDKMIEATKAEIEKKFGSGSIMRFGDGGQEMEIEAIPTGALSLDAALGIGGVPRGRIIEIYGPNPPERRRFRWRSLPRRKPPAASSRSSMRSMRSIPLMQRASVSISMRCSSRNPIPVSKRSRSAICSSAPVPSTPSSSTL